MTEILARILSVFMGRMVARVAQFVVFILLGRVLEPAQFGWYGLLMTAIVLAAQLGSLGLRQSAAFWLGRGRAAPAGVLGTLIIVLPCLSVVSAAGILLMVDLSLAGLPGMFVPAILLAGMLGAMAVMLMQGMFLGRGQTALFGMSDSLHPVLLMLVTGILFLTGNLDFLTAVFAFIGAQLFAGLITIGLAMRDGIARPDLRAVPEMIRHGLSYAVNIFLILLSTRVSIFLVDHLATTADAGQFFAGQRLGDMLGEAAMAAGLVLFSETVRSDDPEAALRRNARLGAWILWVFTLLSFVVALLAEPLVRIMFGTDFASAADVLRITALAVGPSAATKIIYPSLSAYGRPLWGSPAILASIAVNAGLAWVLIPIHGVAGAAWALVASQIILLLGYALVLKLRFAIGFRETLIPGRR